MNLKCLLGSHDYITKVTPPGYYPEYKEGELGKTIRFCSICGKDDPWFSPFILKPNPIVFKPDSSIKFKKIHPDAQLPKVNNTDPETGDAGMDVFSVEDAIIPKHGKKQVDVGLEFADIPKGYFVRVESRSGLQFKYSVSAFNGIIDCCYRGNAGILLINNSSKDYEVKKGDRIAQLILYKMNKVNVEFSDTKTETVRNNAGFGSSGK